jgi:hypothetical protein
MDAATRSRLLSLVCLQPRAAGGVTGVTGLTAPATWAEHTTSHHPLHARGGEKAQSDQDVTPVTPGHTPPRAGEREQGAEGCDGPGTHGVPARVTLISALVDADDWQAVYDERVAIGNSKASSLELKPSASPLRMLSHTGSACTRHPQPTRVEAVSSAAGATRPTTRSCRCLPLAVTSGCTISAGRLGPPSGGAKLVRR